LDKRTAKNKGYGQKYTQAVRYIKKFVKSVGEFMPDDCNVHLPVYRTVELYRGYLTYILDQGLQPCSFSYFHKVFRSKRFKHVKIYKFKRFARCDSCFTLDRDARDAANGKLGYCAQSIAALKHEHFLEHRAERDQYNDKVHLSATQPHKFWAHSGDGMSDWKSSVPNFSRPPHQVDNTVWPKNSVYGTFNHGHKPRVVAFTADDRIRHGGNFCVEVLLQTLIRKKTGWPPILFLQGDNTVKDIKNNCYLMFCYWMVEMGLFKEVSLSSTITRARIVA
jgi:hypothetical protein